CLLFISSFFTDPASVEICSLPLHDALPILLWLGLNSIQSAFSSVTAGSPEVRPTFLGSACLSLCIKASGSHPRLFATSPIASVRSEEHTSELQSRENLVCRLLLEEKKIQVK